LWSQAITDRDRDKPLSVSAERRLSVAAAIFVVLHGLGDERDGTVLDKAGRRVVSASIPPAGAPIAMARTKSAPRLLFDLRSDLLEDLQRRA
jgi:hypothetical protein